MNFFIWRLAHIFGLIVLIGVAAILVFMVQERREFAAILFSLLGAILGMLIIFLLQFYNWLREIGHPFVFDLSMPLVLRLPNWQRSLHIVAWSLMALGLACLMPAILAAAYGYDLSPAFLPALFAALAVAFLLLLWGSRRLAETWLPTLTFDDEGLDCSRFGCAPIDWLDIADVKFHLPNKSPPLIILTLRHAAEYVAASPGLSRLDRFFYRHFGHNPFRLVPESFGVTPEFLYQAIAAYRAVYATGEAPSLRNPSILVNIGTIVERR